jgi:HAD superfamily hydrolase (TIGR01458 family)
MRAILFDLDGVIYNGEEPIPGAAQAIEWVRGQAIPHLFVTNTSSRGPRELAAKLLRFGIKAEPEAILTPGEVAADWLRARRDGPAALFLLPAARAAFEGIELVSENAETGARYVVIGDLGAAWNFATLNRAFRLLHSDAGATLIALGMTRFWKSPSGLSLDVAPFVAALEHATERKALVFGKPAPAFFAGAAQRLGMEAADILMVGDDIQVDVGAAQAAGLKGALVRTGKFRAADLNGEVRPDVVLDSLAELPKWWNNHEKKDRAGH